MRRRKTCGEASDLLWVERRWPSLARLKNGCGEILLNLPGQPPRREIRLEEMTAQAMREPVEVQAGLRRGLAGSPTRFSERIEDARRVEYRLEPGREAGRGDNRVERFAGAVGEH